MKVETQEWVSKAEGDWQVANREIQNDSPVWDVVSFLCQQCAEKYLKAFLEEYNIQFRKTHDLVLLHDSSGGLLPELDAHRVALAHLTVFGIAARYPGTEADEPAATDALNTADTVRTVIRTKLGL